MPARPIQPPIRLSRRVPVDLADVVDALNYESRRVLAGSSRIEIEAPSPTTVSPCLIPLRVQPVGSSTGFSGEMRLWRTSHGGTTVALHGGFDGSPERLGAEPPAEEVLVLFDRLVRRLSSAATDRASLRGVPLN